MAWIIPSADDFKGYFARDFNFAPDSDPDNLDYITDSDIDKAIAEAEINFNSALFGTDAQVNIVFFYLVAFYLVFNLQNSAKGISSQSKFPISANSVGGVSVSYQLPEKYSKDPTLSVYTQNGYGMKYLSLTMPFLVGNIGLQQGTTTWG